MSRGQDIVFLRPLLPYLVLKGFCSRIALIRTCGHSQSVSYLSSVLPAPLGQAANIPSEFQQILHIKEWHIEDTAISVEIGRDKRVI